MGIFEGEDEAASQQGRVSELNAGAPLDLALDPLRDAIGAVLDADGTRVGTIVTSVETWWAREGLLRRRSVDPRESVRAELSFDPVELGDDGYPVEQPWLDADLEKDDPVVLALLEGVLLYPDRDLTVRWFQGADAVREREGWDRRFD